MLDYLRDVTESKIQRVSRHCLTLPANKLSKLSVISSITQLTDSGYYDRESGHDLVGERDRGYMGFYDVIGERMIYVAPIRVAYTLAFNKSMNVHGIINVTTGNRVHGDFSNMRKGDQLWLLNNFR